jgi:hypothetical protein
MRVINRNSCGSGSIVGHYNGKTLAMTNAHVAGTSIGRVVQCDIPAINGRKSFRVIRAAYSNQVVADWALLESVDDWQAIDPVFMTQAAPNLRESFYTQGYPRCQAMQPGNITPNRRLNSGVVLWKPNAIGGQSGSAIWNDDSHYMQMLLTWSYTIQGQRYGAGQPTDLIYRQNRAAIETSDLIGPIKPPGLEELIDYDLTDVDMDGVEDDPIVEEGFFDDRAGETGRVSDGVFNTMLINATELGIQDFPIWAEDQDEPDDPDDPPTDDRVISLAELLHQKTHLVSLTVNNLVVDLKQWIDENKKPETGGGNDDDFTGGL